MPDNKTKLTMFGGSEKFSSFPESDRIKKIREYWSAGAYERMMRLFKRFGG